MVKGHGVKVKGHWVKVKGHMGQGQIRFATDNALFAISLTFNLEVEGHMG